jgi:hypothetical protein
VFTRVILPLALFVAVVAGTAWVVQYLPSWRERRRQAVTAPSPPALVFEQKEAVWDPGDKDYVAEFEFGPGGHYDYPFTNPSPTPVRLGLTSVNCGCVSKVLVCLLSREELEKYKRDKSDSGLRWEPLAKDEQHGVTVPPDSAGIIRPVWGDRSASGRRNFTIKLWSQPEGKGRDQETFLVAPVAFVTPVRYYPEMRDVGRIAPGGVARADYWFWSATRDHFAVDVKEKKDDPCFEFRKVLLDSAERAELQKRLKGAGINTRVLSAYRVEAVVHEERGGRQLDLGPFQRTVPFAIDEPVPDLPGGPLLKGWVLGDITVGNPEDLGHIDLKSFPIKVPPEPRRVPLWTRAGVKVVKDQVPDFLDVTLTEKETTANKTHWELRVGVKSRLLRPGTLPEDSAIILRTEGMPPRRIRIPVLGTAVQR